MAGSFESFIVKTDGCWYWQGCINEWGYGMYKRNKKAHRIAFERYYNRAIRPGMLILHSCDTPTCVNPEHLREGTHQENMNDKVLRGRCPAKITQQIANQIRVEYATGTIFLKTLSKNYGISITTISNIINGKSWRVKNN